MIPTREHRTILRAHKLWWTLWTVDHDYNHGYLVRNRITGEMRYIKK